MLGFNSATYYNKARAKGNRKDLRTLDYSQDVITSIIDTMSIFHFLNIKVSVNTGYRQHWSQQIN